MRFVTRYAYIQVVVICRGLQIPRSVQVVICIWIEVIRSVQVCFKCSGRQIPCLSVQVVVIHT